MANGVEELLGMLYDMIEDGKSVPMHPDQCRIDRDRALDLLDEIRAQFPVELGEAQKLIASRDEFIAEAKRTAEETRAKAHEQAKRLLNENEIVKQAKDIANEMMYKAQTQSEGLKRAATDYCDDLLRQTDEEVIKLSDGLQQLRIKFKQLSKAATQKDGQ